MQLRPPAIASAFVFLGAALRSQQPAVEPVIRVSVGLVQVDVTVTDANGRHISDLRPDEFEIQEDGKPQKVTTFSYINAQADAKSQFSGVSQTKDFPLFSRGLKAQQVRRTLALVADNLGIAASNIAKIKTALRDFVDKQMLPGDLVSILTTSGGVGALQQFTNDKRQLYAAIERIRWFPGRIADSPFDAFVDSDPIKAGAMERINRQVAAVKMQKSGLDARSTIESVRYVIHGMRGLPGRKALILVSEGISAGPEGLRDLVDDANSAGLILDTVDPRGVVVTELTASDNVLDRHVYRASGYRAAFYKASQRSLEALAGSTGGIFIGGNNDFNAALTAAIADTDGYYLLGYQPRRSDLTTASATPVFHAIHVKVLREGLTVRTRSGFYSGRELLTPDPSGSRTAQLRDALYSPFRGDLPMRLSTLYSAGAKDAKSGRLDALLRAVLVIDAHDLTFENQPGGTKKAVLDVVGAVFGADSKMVTSSDKNFTVNLSSEEWRKTVESGFVYQMYVPVARPGAYQFRVAMRDAGSGKTGSASSFVEIPDFNRRRLTLSSMELSGGVATDEITRTFAPGSLVDFACGMFGESVNKQTGQPKVEYEIRLFRGPEQIFQSRMIAVPLQNSGKPRVLAGSLRLPQTLPDGDYSMELAAYDRLAKPDRQEAKQWIDFSLLAHRHNEALPQVPF